MAATLTICRWVSLSLLTTGRGHCCSVLCLSMELVSSAHLLSVPGSQALLAWPLRSRLTSAAGQRVLPGLPTSYEYRVVVPPQTGRQGQSGPSLQLLMLPARHGDRLGRTSIKDLAQCSPVASVSAHENASSALPEIKQE